MSKTARCEGQGDTSENIVQNLDTLVVMVGKCKGLDEDEVNRPRDATINQEIMECKICLQSSKDAPQPFIQPCLCTGSLRHVHEECFQQWMKRLIIQKNLALNALPKAVSCQLCKMEYQIETNLEKVCISWQRFKVKSRTKTCQFVVLLSLILGSLIILAIAGAIVPKSIFNVGESSPDNSQVQNGVWQKVIVIFCICILGLILLLSLYVFIQRYCFAYSVEFKYKVKQQKTMKVIFQALQQSSHGRH